MTKKIPKLAKIIALVHFVFASVFFISAGIYGLLWPNKEGYVPILLLVPMIILFSIDYPLAWIAENWSVIKSSPYFFFIFITLFGTVMWFTIGFLLSKLINRFRKTGKKKMGPDL